MKYRIVGLLVLAVASAVQAQDDAIDALFAEPEAIRATAANAERNQVEIETLRCSWDDACRSIPSPSLADCCSGARGRSR